MDTVDDTAEWVSPRVMRTKARVVAAAREILLTHGPAALTYTSLARRGVATRQTLYKHWPTPQALLVAVVLASPNTSYPKPGPDAGVVITEFLLSLRDGLTDPPTAAAFLAVAAQAPYDPVSASALRDLISGRTDALNNLLVQTSVSIDADDYALLTGPVLLHVLFSHSPIDVRFVRRIVDAWSSTDPGSSQAQT